MEVGVGDTNVFVEDGEMEGLEGLEGWCPVI